MSLPERIIRAVVTLTFAVVSCWLLVDAARWYHADYTTYGDYSTLNHVMSVALLVVLGAVCGVLTVSVYDALSDTYHDA